MPSEEEIIAAGGKPKSFVGKAKVAIAKNPNAAVIVAFIVGIIVRSLFA